MRESTFRLIVGVALLIAAYLDLAVVIALVALLSLLEGLTNFRVPAIVSRILGERDDGDATDFPATARRFDFEAERVLRLIVAALLAAALAFPISLWFLPWILAFALIAAGISGQCALLLVLHRLGFR